MGTGGHPMGINPLEPSRDKPFIEPSHHHHEPMSHHVHDRSGTKVKRSPPLGELDSGVASMSLEDPNGPPDFNKYQNLSKTAMNQSNQSKTLQPNALSATQTQYDYDIEKSQTLPERSKSRPDRKKRYLPRNPSLNDSFERKPFRSQVCITSRVYAVKIQCITFISIKNLTYILRRIYVHPHHEIRVAHFHMILVPKIGD